MEEAWIPTDVKVAVINDLVHMLEEMGVETSVDLEALLRVARRVQEVVGHADSAVLRAGTSR